MCEAFRFHTSFNQTVTGTGRLSSSDPNLQNIPIRTEDGRRIRSAFIAPPGRCFIVADYSQVELRILAHMSGDENLIEAFKKGEDIHAKTAREILGIPEGEPLKPEERRMGKTINFGIIYGMSGFRLSRELGIPVSVANEYIDSYFRRYPKVREYFDKVAESARRDGYVTTLFGRRRNISDIDTTGRDRDFVMRAAINAPIQGTAADIIKLAMVKIDRDIRSLPADMVLQVHDELVLECDLEAREEVAKIVEEDMVSVVDLALPLVVDVHWGKNWNEAHG
ncbi:MAG: hypothetical protein D6808_07910 [Candidatus Dadabacteria bacterium]|nr:MAG: hypothetical protein D6808_07910 [Candidatus Dadabacteria bacterium]